MDWKTFIATVIESLAWPSVVVIIVLGFRDKLETLVPRLTRFKSGYIEAEFSERINQLASENEECLLPAESLGINDDFPADLKDSLDDLLILANVSPRSAIIEAFLIAESAVAKIVSVHFPTDSLHSIKTPAQAKLLLQHGIFTESQFHQFNELRILRNKAAHAEEFQAREVPLKIYIRLAILLALACRRYEEV
ncbi:hypothetical protein [Candidatus Albibeggiatoa sp. nov. NOAA]|uniref:hypothetical protein n=1 Tax=Candidatus Albibeggiatoa sp. nov. NOAA TaxID=3162724 RepID=UPI0032F9D7F2|nr:hypothetical protein [Thiotrichaceae bacterium]